MGCTECSCTGFETNSDPTKQNKCGKDSCGHASQKHTKA